jgi:hypothetical protein
MAVESLWILCKKRRSGNGGAFFARHPPSRPADFHQGKRYNSFKINN